MNILKIYRLQSVRYDLRLVRLVYNAMQCVQCTGKTHPCKYSTCLFFRQLCQHIVSHYKPGSRHHSKII